MEANIHAESRATAIGRRKVCEVPHIRAGAMGTSLRIAGLCASVLIFISGCNRIARSWYLSSYDRDISSATKAIETARNYCSPRRGIREARQRLFGKSPL